MEHQCELLSFTAGIDKINVSCKPWSSPDKSQQKEQMKLKSELYKRVTGKYHRSEHTLGRHLLVTLIIKKWWNLITRSFFPEIIIFFYNFLIIISGFHSIFWPPSKWWRKCKLEFTSSKCELMWTTNELFFIQIQRQHLFI